MDSGNSDCSMESFPRPRIRHNAGSGSRASGNLAPTPDVEDEALSRAFERMTLSDDGDEQIPGPSRQAVTTAASSERLDPTAEPILPPPRNSLRVSKRKADDDWEREADPLIVLTPSQALEMLSGQDIFIEVCIGKKRNAGGGDPYLWKCLIVCAELQVEVYSARKELAREVGSEQFLCRLPLIHPECQIPKYELFEELFIDPRIDDEVKSGRKVCYKLDMIPSTGTGKRCRAANMYHCSLFLGSHTFEGEHCHVDCAKVIAKKNAYMQILGREPVATPYFTNEEPGGERFYDILEADFIY